MIIPCLAGVFLFNTPIAPMQGIGFVMFMIAAYLMIMDSKITIKGCSVKTVLLLIAVMLTEGLSYTRKSLR